MELGLIPRLKNPCPSTSPGDWPGCGKSKEGVQAGTVWGAPPLTPSLSPALPVPTGHPHGSLPVWGRGWDAVPEDKALDQESGALAWSPGFALELLCDPKRSSHFSDYKFPSALELK